VNNLAIYHKHVYFCAAPACLQDASAADRAKQQTGLIDHDNVRILQIKLHNSSWKLHI